MPDLRPFFAPKSIAVVGASERPESLGGVVLDNLIDSGFAGTISAVNLKGYARVKGVSGYRYLRDIPEPPDLVVLCTPPETLTRVLRQMGRLKLKAALILTGGLARQRTQSERLNERIAQLAQDLKVQVMGPHCLGILVPDQHLNASFAHLDALPGNVAYVGHSAALGSALLDWAGARGIGFSHFLTLGDSVDVRISDVVDALAADRRVRSILVHLEQIRDAHRLLIALRAAARTKKVLVLRTHTGQQTAEELKQLGRLDREYFARAGVLQVTTMDGLFQGLEVLSRARPLPIRKLTIVANGYGTAMLARQYLVEQGGQLAQIERTESLRKRAWYRQETALNPVILPPQATGEDYLRTLQELEKQAEAGAILLIHSPNRRQDSLDIAEALLTHFKRSRRLILSCFLGGHSTIEARRLLDGRGLLNFDSPTEAVNAYLTLADHAEAQEQLKQTPSTAALSFEPNVEEAKRVIYQARKQRRGYLTWPETRALLRAYQFHLVDSTFDTDFDRLVGRLTGRFYPAALRLVHEAYCYPFAYQGSPAARWRGVKTDLQNETSLALAKDELLVEKRLHYPASKRLGWAVQPMRRKVDSVQFSLGITRDDTYGPLVFVGEGGSHADMLADRQCALVPINSALAKQMIERTHGYQVLLERSKNIQADLASLVNACVVCSQLAVLHPRIQGLEINLLLETGQMPTVLGAAAALGEKVRPALNPYPAHLEEKVTLKNKKSVVLRPIRAEDEPALKQFFESFDAESLRLRFFYSRHHFEHLELAVMSQIDYQREMVFVAMEGTTMVGELRLWWDVQQQSMEFSIMVSHHYQGTGLASRLLAKGEAHAINFKVQKMVADVLPENQAMLHLAQRFGYQFIADEDAVRIEKPLPIKRKNQ